MRTSWRKEDRDRSGRCTVYCDPLVSYGGASWRFRIYAPPHPLLFLSTPMILPLWTFKTVSDQILPSRCYFMPFDCYYFILVLCYYFVLLPLLLLLYFITLTTLANLSYFVRLYYSDRRDATSYDLTSGIWKESRLQNWLFGSKHAIHSPC